MLFFLLADGILLVFSLVASVLLRFDGRVPPRTLEQLPLVVVLSLTLKLPAFASQRLYSLSWSQVGLEDMLMLVRGVSLGSVALWLSTVLMKKFGLLLGFPRSILVLDYVISLHLVGGLRLSKRVYEHLVRRMPNNGVPALVVGAGSAGEQLLRSIRRATSSGYLPVGFIDDDPRKIGTVIHGVPVLGDRNCLPDVVRRYGVEAVLVAMPSASSRAIRSVVALARQAGVREIRIVPGLESILNGQISFTDLREVQLADLLGREMVRIDPSAVEQWIAGGDVLITGAAGSIGSELCRQIVRFHPRSVIALDWDESGLFWVEEELRRLGQLCRIVLGDVRDTKRMREVLRKLKPQVVFHAAAYKHVGLMERHPESAVMTNIMGTLSVAQACVDAGVRKLVLISTDKAVNPTSVMGATKRVAEQVCLALNQRGSTRFVVVRFGNVLGSRGSVVPLFQDRIRRGEPLMVRGPDMKRYFMAASEAALLVLQAGAMGEGGEIFVLDMGEPIRIADLARELIRLSGLEPDKDVPIVFTEPEPGEKEYEDYLSAEEGTLATRHDRIYIARGNLSMSAEDLLSHISKLAGMVESHDVSGIIRTLQLLVPSYRPSEFVLQMASGEVPSSTAGV